jgi:L-threonylcarbamoyladenylate synthase
LAISQAIRKAGRILRDGGVIAYPTEGVFGLGCLPGDAEAVQRVLTIKQREPDKGLVLIASSQAQLRDWISLPPDRQLTCGGAGDPVTWIVPAADNVSPLIRGSHTGIAVRLTAHPTARALCDIVDAPLVSTSANLSGHPPTRNPLVLRRNIGALVDFIVPGPCGQADGPSEIRDLATGKVIRPA